MNRLKFAFLIGLLALGFYPYLLNLIELLKAVV